MKRFSVVSVDMFGTLANGDSIAPLVWRAFLKDRYTDKLGRQCWNRASQLVFQLYDQVVRERRYVAPKVIYEQCYRQLFPEIGLDFDPAEAARILAHQQSFSQPFADVAPFLESVGKHYPICISSDTDEDMLGQLRRLHPFDNVFTSESLGTYKAGVGGEFFAAVIAYYHEEPGRIIHIGDSVYDVTGANEAGIVTCWLNRNSKTWSHDTKPDYEVKSLAEAAAILGIESIS
ncbi:MAG: HAD family hydrolase [Chloroflexi bacterium]|nr:HAD family hydrolase [Chloroflexota bacterium]